MASSSNRRSGSSGRSTSRKRVVIGANETTRVKYREGRPQVDTERKPAHSRAPSERRTGAGQALARTKREERERRQRAQRLKRIGLAVLVVGLLAGLVFGVSSLYRSDAFAIRAVRVQGAGRLTREQVSALAGIPADATLLRIDRSEIERRIEQNPWVADARVERDFPDVVSITVTERVPAALVSTGGTRWLVDDKGSWLARVKRGVETTPATITIVEVPEVKPVVGRRADSPELANALAVIQGLSPELRAMTRSVAAPAIDRTALLTKDEIEVIIGRAEEMQRKDEIVRRIMAEQRGKVVYINVRTTDRPTWRGLEQQP